MQWVSKHATDNAYSCIGKLFRKDNESKVLRAYSHLTAYRSGLNEKYVEVCQEAVVWERPNRPNDLPLLDVTLSEYRFEMAPRSIDKSIKRIHSAANDSDTASLSSVLLNDTLTSFSSGGLGDDRLARKSVCYMHWADDDRDPLDQHRVIG